MAHCRCKTINLALVSVDKIKQMECKMQRLPGKRYEPRLCPKPEEVPAPPGSVSKRKILVCTIKPVQFQAPPVPCVCPPCPPCPTYGEKSMDLLKTGFKLFVLYVAFKWTIDNQIWGDHKGTSDFMLGLMGSNLSNDGNPKLPDMQRFKYRILHTWDFLIGNFFYYTFGLPLKISAQIRDSMAIREEDPCEEYCATKVC